MACNVKRLCMNAMETRSGSGAQLAGGAVMTVGLPPGLPGWLAGRLTGWATWLAPSASGPAPPRGAPFGASPPTRSTTQPCQREVTTDATARVRACVHEPFSASTLVQQSAWTMCAGEERCRGSACRGGEARRDASSDDASRVGDASWPRDASRADASVRVARHTRVWASRPRARVEGRVWVDASQGGRRVTTRPRPTPGRHAWWTRQASHLRATR